jgi:hypothetical protein
MKEVRGVREKLPGPEQLQKLVLIPALFLLALWAAWLMMKAFATE